MLQYNISQSASWSIHDTSRCPTNFSEKGVNQQKNNPSTPHRFVSHCTTDSITVYVHTEEELTNHNLTSPSHMIKKYIYRSNGTQPQDNKHSNATVRTTKTPSTHTTRNVKPLTAYTPLILYMADHCHVIILIIMPIDSPLLSNNNLVMVCKDVMNRQRSHCRPHQRQQ